MNYKSLDPILEPLMAAVRRAEEFLGPEDDWVEDDRRILFEAAQRHLGHLHHFTREKTQNEYVTTVHADPDVVERILDSEGYDRNLASTRKYRTHHGGGKQWAVGAFALDGLKGDHGYVEQHHVCLFPAPNSEDSHAASSVNDSSRSANREGATDVYAHRETSVLEGAEHLTDTNQEHGAPHNLFDIFDRHDVEYGDRQL